MKLISRLCCLWLLFSVSAWSADTIKMVRIGVLAFNGKDQAIRRWYPTAQYLSQHIKGYQFDIVPLSHADIRNAINKGQLDFILTNPGHYVRLEVTYGATRIVTFSARFQNKKLTQFSTVIFSDKNKPINTLEDLRGKPFAAVSEDAFGGFQLAQQQMLEHGINALEDLKIVWMGFPQSDIVHEVLQGKADAGTVRSGILEQMAEQNLIDLSRLRILNARQDDGFPLLHSAPLYPEWPLAQLPQTDEGLAKRVAITLLQMHPNAAAAIAAKGAGWTIPQDYSSIHQVFRQLQVAPYQPVPLEMKDFWQSYRHWVFLLVFSFLLMGLALLFYSNITRKLKQSKQQLIQHKNQLEAVVEQRTAELMETNVALQQDIQSRILFEETLHDGCDTLQALYSITLRHDLTREQRLQSIVDQGRHYFRLNGYCYHVLRLSNLSAALSALPVKYLKCHCSER